MGNHHLWRGNRRKMLLLIFDILCFLFIDTAYFLITMLPDGKIPYELSLYCINSAVLLIGLLFFRIFFRIYTNVWRYANTKLYFVLVLSDMLGGIAALILPAVFGTYEDIWHPVTVAALTALASLMARFSYKLYYMHRRVAKSNKHPHINVAIVGAGQMGALLVNDLQRNKVSKYRPCFFIDRDYAKIGSKVNGLRVYEEERGVVKKLIRENEIREVFIAMALPGNERLSELYHFYREMGCKVKIYDTPLRETVEQDGNERHTLREIRIEDLLFRQPIHITGSVVAESYTGKVILVTGGGGSIGSELCRQLAKCHPSKLIILDIYENNAYEIQQELIRQYGDTLDLCVEIASVRDRDRLECIFKAYRPDIVFHAAAHKHVPLMEHSACEAIKNNVFGTYDTADMAEKYGVSRFILISTDKAVNPTNVMGASKRLCEMIVQSRHDSRTSFAAVRFGNVLGSNGSVIPLFRRQIESGGPLTITDKRIIRYFMTIPEASQLVMLAGAMAKRGELFVLDMGKPVRIYDLAINMIKLAGLEPDVDIEIKEIGLRPGEKLYEELLMRNEHQEKTENNMIFVEKDAPLTREEVKEKLDLLREAIEASKTELSSVLIRDTVARVVPTFRLSSEINRSAESSEEMQSVKKQ